MPEAHSLAIYVMMFYQLKKKKLYSSCLPFFPLHLMKMTRIEWMEYVNYLSALLCLLASFLGIH